MSTIFTKIINREIPAHILAEDAHHIAFLDVRPLAKGHTLCVPKREVDKLFQLERQEYLALMDFAYTLSQALEKAIICKRVGLAVLGLEVPHAHLHLVPLQTEKDLNFSSPRLTFSSTECAETVRVIQQYLR